MEMFRYSELKEEVLEKFVEDSDTLMEEMKKINGMLLSLVNSKKESKDSGKRIAMESKTSIENKIAEIDKVKERFGKLYNDALNVILTLQKAF